MVDRDPETHVREEEKELLSPEQCNQVNESGADRDGQRGGEIADVMLTDGLTFPLPWLMLSHC